MAYTTGVEPSSVKLLTVSLGFSHTFQRNSLMCGKLAALNTIIAVADTLEPKNDAAA